MSAFPDDLTEAQARAMIEPWYSMSTRSVRGDIAAPHEQAVTPDYQSLTGEGANESWGRDVPIEVISGFATSIPNMKFEVKEVLVAGNRVIVRGEVSGMPAGALFGGLIPHSGKTFRIMAIDI
jgi:hypothetical protein